MTVNENPGATAGTPAVAWSVEARRDPIADHGRSTRRGTQTDVAIASRCFAAALLCMTFTVGCAADAPARHAPDSIPASGHVRDVSLINNNWRFIRSDIPEASATKFDDSKWEQVTLPHTWNLLDGTDGGDNYYRGAGWYRRELDANAGDLKAGKRFYLRFGAASLVADVYVNGTHIGQHRGGFAAFCYDVTDQLHAGANELSVRVDNTRVDDIAPQSGDFTVFGGLYRDVELLVLDPVHISPIDDASSGVYLRQTNGSAKSAAIAVTTKLRNASAQTQKTTVEVDVRDASHAVVAKAVTTQSIDARSQADAATQLEIPKPHLWQGVQDPYFYTTQISISVDGHVVDQVSQPLGLRSIAIDSQRGLLLNGQRYAMHGVNVHQEVADKGWAGSAADYALNYKLIREVGATCVRMAHYQHNEAEYSLCDANGLAVWTEIPLVEGFGKSPAFRDNVKQQLRELIKQNFNHPSVVTWGLWNELAPPPEDENWSMVKECAALAHELDPSRPTTAAHHLSAKSSVVNIPDVIALNRYTGWYGGDATAWKNTLDQIRAETPGRPIAISEYGAGGSVKQHELHPARVEAGGEWHPEEYQCYVHEQAWRAMKARDDLWGTFIWNMFDFNVDRRKEGDHAGRNDKGLVTIDRKTKKDVFYFYQANWTAEPMVHITSSRYEPYPIGQSDVKVYSNCDEVDLLIDGKSIGKRRGVDGVFIWPSIDFLDGPITLRAVGTKGGKSVADEVVHRVSRDAIVRTTPPRPSPATTPATTRAAH